MRMISLIDSIKNHESYKPKPYIDPLAHKKIPKDEYNIIVKNWDKLVPTFGYGFTYLDEDEANLVLKMRVNKIENQLKNKLLFYEILPQNQKDVLIEMAYQLGVSGLLSFKKMLAALGSQRIPEAIKEMKNSLWYRQTTNRANDLIRKLKNGDS